MNDPERSPVSPETPTSDAEEPIDLSEHPILFFDGVCGLCDSTVDWLLKRDRDGVLRFAPLQGETAGRMLSPAETASLSSVVLKDDAGNHRQSRAIVRALGRLGGRYRLYSWLLWLIPAPLREFGYGMIAKVRYRVFGKRETCRMPSPAERGRLLP